jgi:2-hydroxychromene-2-carboxylate isomerase
MTPEVDFYFSFRSPYSYLAAQQAEALTEEYDLSFRMRIVRPIALRVPGFFKRLNPLGPPYVMRDTSRVAERLGIAYKWPTPDPIVMDMASGEVAENQPYIYRISRLGAAAEEAGPGLMFAAAVSRIIWSGEVENWHEGGCLEPAATAAGLNLDSLEEAIARDPDRYDAIIRLNEAEQAGAGHWGVPLFVFKEEPFFGQDRLQDLMWRLGQYGVLNR